MQKNELTRLFESTVNQILSSRINLERFLFFASRHHKQSFVDQVMIYAQNPNATVVTTAKSWYNLGGQLAENAKPIISFRVNGEGIPVPHYLYDEYQLNTKPKQIGIVKSLWRLNRSRRDNLASYYDSLFPPPKAIKERIQTLVSAAADEYMTKKPQITERELVQEIAYFLCCSKLRLIDVHISENAYQFISHSQNVKLYFDAINYTAKKVLNDIESILRERSVNYEQHNQVHHGESQPSRLQRIQRGGNDSRQTGRAGGREPILSVGNVRPDDASVSGGRKRTPVQKDVVRRDDVSGSQEVQRSNDHNQNSDIGTAGDKERRKNQPDSKLYGARSSQRTTSVSGGGTNDRTSNRGTGEAVSNDGRTDESAGRSVAGVMEGASVLKSKSNDKQSELTPEERFTVVEVDDHIGDPYAVWDDLHNDYYDDEGVTATFRSHFEAEAYRQQIIQQFSSGALPEVEESTQTSLFAKNENAPQTEIKPVSNFYSADTEINYGGAKTKFRNNLAAIQLLKELETQSIQATPEQQLILSKYTGWGGIPQVFDEQQQSWATEYAELKRSLTEQEYEQARRSTLNAHYTEPYIIQSIYDAVQGFGFHGGKILEPSMGVGYFFSAMPTQLQSSDLYGIEIDSISGRISKQLFPQANIQVKGYQDTEFPDNLFDLAIGNIPFGDYRVHDKRYDKQKLFIHDYFIVKTLDLIKPNGLVAFITTKGTLDKANASMRKYVAQRAELLGAIRLPNHTFKNVANTEVTTDILFFRKREKEIITEPNWIHLGLTVDNVPVNQYYLDNPDMMLGTMKFDSSMYGNEKLTTCAADKSMDLKDALHQAVQKLTDSELERTEQLEPLQPQDAAVIGWTDEKADSNFSEVAERIPATPDVKNFTFTIIDDRAYYRENSFLILRGDIKGKALERIRGMHEIRKMVRRVIDIQTTYNYQQAELKEEQKKLSDLYDRFVKKFDFISTNPNRRVMSEDADWPLLTSLEIRKKDHFEKAAIFTNATIRPPEEFKVTNAEQALSVSLFKTGGVDLEYMQSVYDGHNANDIVTELGDRIYLDPKYIERSPTEQQKHGYIFCEEYLSGNVKQKLDTVRSIVLEYPELQLNVDALIRVQPPRLNISQIEFEIGTAWIPLEYIQQFMYDTLQVYKYNQCKVGEYEKNKIYIAHDEISTRYTIYNKFLCKGLLNTSTFGTKRKPATAIIEDCLNLKQVEVTDIYLDDNNKERRRINPKETQLARAKQEKLQQEFKSWIVQDPKRIRRIENIYNDTFNVFVPRHYHCDELYLSNMSNSISLRQHQKDAAMRILLGGNTLLAHEVGAGKTYTMAAGAMLQRQSGLCKKPLFVVPAHLTEQWGCEFLQLFPTANLLVATKKDFEKGRRKQFISRIATGEYDAVIMSFNQFEKIPMSAEYQTKMLQQEVDDITTALSNSEQSNGRGYSIKQLEKQKLQLEEKIERLLDNGRRDDTLTFEQLGVDRLFVDEAHYYKNCYIHTKINNVAGLGSTGAEKSFDMLIKTKYITEQNNGKGVVFATGTPITNSISEMFVMQRYLQNDLLKSVGVEHFDQWAGAFAKIENSIEIAPEGTGFRSKSRFTKFYNLPELMNMFHQSADVKLVEELGIERPALVGGKVQTITIEPSEYVTAKIQELAERAELIRSGSVDAQTDNMLKVTHEGRAVAIDPRILDPEAPVNRDSKIYACCDKVAGLYRTYGEDKALQLIFLDAGITMYPIIRDELISQGIKAEEIAFIHDAKTEKAKAELFEKCRSGDVRVLLGSTAKMGAGTNIQERMIALHHVDCPWRPADLEQRNGRIRRQGNMYPEVNIFQYITKGTFDSYLFQLQEQKQRFISQIMTNQSSVRSCDDLDETVLSYAEVKALAVGDTRIRDKMELDTEVQRLTLEKQSYLSEQSRMRDFIESAPKEIREKQQSIAQLQKDIATYMENAPSEFSININGFIFHKKVEAGEALEQQIRDARDKTSRIVGKYAGLNLIVEKDGWEKSLYLKGEYKYPVSIGTPLGTIMKIENAPEHYPNVIENMNRSIDELKQELDVAQERVTLPFEKEELLKEKSEQKAALDFEIEMELKHGNLEPKSGEAIHDNNEFVDSDFDFDMN